jgi:anti-anti-sigma factor
VTAVPLPSLFLSSGLLSVRIQQRDSDVVIVMDGEIDMSTADEVAFALRVAWGSVIVDLSEVTFCDSTGLAALIQAHSVLGNEGRNLRVVGAQPNVRRLFETTGLESLLTDGIELDSTLTDCA